MRINCLLFIILLISITACEQEQSVENAGLRSVSTDSLRFELPPLPTEVNLFDSLVKLEDFDLRERLDKELIVNTYYHSSTIQGIKRANRYFPKIEKILREHNLPEDFKYLCLIESGLTQAVSPSGAKGFWQFMPKTAMEYGLKVNREIDERLHIEKSTLAACEYLTDAYNIFGEWTLAAASYNMGTGGVQRELDNQLVDNYYDLYLNPETSRYVFRIMAMKIIMENQEAYGFKVAEKYDEIHTKEIKVNESIPNLMVWAKQHRTNYKMLKRLNPWILGTKLTVKNGDSLVISVLEK